MVEFSHTLQDQNNVTVKHQVGVGTILSLCRCDPLGDEISTIRVTDRQLFTSFIVRDCHRIRTASDNYVEAIFLCAARDGVATISKHHVFSKAAIHRVGRALIVGIIDRVHTIPAGVAIDCVRSKGVDKNITAIATTDEVVAFHACVVKATVFVQHNCTVLAFAKEDTVITSATSGLIIADTHIHGIICDCSLRHIVLRAKSHKVLVARLKWFWCRWLFGVVAATKINKGHYAQNGQYWQKIEF